MLGMKGNGTCILSRVPAVSQGSNVCDFLFGCSANKLLLKRVFAVGLCPENSIFTSRSLTNCSAIRLTLVINHFAVKGKIFTDIFLLNCYRQYLSTA